MNPIAKNRFILLKLDREPDILSSIFSTSLKYQSLGLNFEKLLNEKRLKLWLKTRLKTICFQSLNN